METTPIAGVRANRRSRATPLSGARRTPGSTPRVRCFVCFVVLSLLDMPAHNGQIDVVPYRAL
jgi:hypothetical protein